MRMAGYSATPLARKLGIKSGHVIALLDAPPTLPELLAPLPDETDVRTSLDGGPFDVVVCFTTKRDDLVRHVAQVQPVLAVAGGLWIAWPKKAARVPTDLADNKAVRELRLSELFTGPGRSLLVYQLMFGKLQTEPCPMCTMWIDGF